MTKIARPDVLVGQTWRDRDKRMMSGNRRVVVTLVAFGYVTYRSYSSDRLLYRSRYDRFQRAFDLVNE